MFATAQLLELTGGLAAIDAREVLDDELLDAAVAVQRADSMLGVTRAHVFAELEARGVCRDRHGLTTATWVAREANTSSAAVRAQVSVGRALRDHFDEVDRAVVSRQLSYEHAKAIAGLANRRNIEALAERQGEIIADAEGATFFEWRDTLRRLAALLDTDGPEPRVDDNELHLFDGIDGFGHLRGTFTPEEWAVIKHAVNERADKLFREFSDMHELSEEIGIPCRKTLLALALEQLVREGLGVDLESSRGPRTDVTIIMRPGDAEHGEGDVAVDRDGVRLPDSILPRYLCDPEFTSMLVDSLGVPLDLGRKRRLANEAQRRAAAARDGGCTFPGCDKPSAWTELHHAHHWQRHGLTDLSNLPSACSLHHGIAHREGWDIHLHHDGWHFWQTPSGQTFWAQRHRRRRTDPPPPPRQPNTAAAA